MNWIDLKEENQIAEIDKISAQTPVLIFKHSTRCSISSSALSRLERQWKSELIDIKTYYLDLLNFRSISNLLAQHYNIEHQSPQIILVKNGKSIHSASHQAIGFEEVMNGLK